MNEWIISHILSDNKNEGSTFVPRYLIHCSTLLIYNVVQKLKLGSDSDSSEHILYDYIITIYALKTPTYRVGT